MRRITGTRDLTGFQTTLISRLNQDPGTAISTAPPAAEPAPSLSFQDVSVEVQTSVAKLFAPQPAQQRDGEQRSKCPADAHQVQRQRRVLASERIVQVADQPGCVFKISNVTSAGVRQRMAQLC